MEHLKDSNVKLIQSLDTRCAQVELMISKTAAEHQKITELASRHRIELSCRAKDAIKERRELRKCKGTNTARIASISKEIQHELTKSMRRRCRERISEILSNFKDLKSIASIRSNGKSQFISSVKDSHGQAKHSRQDIADVFADFYTDLYRSRDAQASPLHRDHPESDAVPDVTAEEVGAILKKMAKRKAGDTSGLVVEMLQKGGSALWSLLAELFTDVLKPEAAPPEQWRKARLIVLFKKGDKQDPANYRPISLLPLLYKLFAKVLDSRIGGILDAAQTVDQAGFRTGFSCEDHLFTIVMLEEKMHEHQLPLWVATIYDAKAFDTVSHQSIWSSMISMGVPLAYVRVLAQLYDDQTGEVKPTK